jgi:hypothetical protein
MIIKKEGRKNKLSEAKEPKDWDARELLLCSLFSRSFNLQIKN